MEQLTTVNRDKSILKECSGCSQKLPLTEFFKKADAADGRAPYCKACKIKIDQDYREQNKERIAARRKRYRIENKERIFHQRRENRKRNRSAIAIQKKAYAEKNKKKLSKWFSEHKKANRASYNALNQKRKANKLQATPAWLTSLDLEHIKLFYEAAADQKQHGLDIHVDHIVPLQGKDVCGLHVPWNLQLLPASENIRKGNKHGQ